MKRLLLAIGLLVTVLGCAESPEDKAAEEHPNANKSPIATMSAAQLEGSFNANGAAFSQKYNEQCVELDGTVTEIGGGPGPYVKLDDGFVGFMCVFPDSATDKLATLHKGQSIKIKGTVTDALVLGMKDCELVP